MYYYVRWGEVQARLERWQKENGFPTRFLHALSLLRDEGKVWCSSSPPTIDFSRWDENNIAEVGALLNSLPVNVDISPAVITDISSTSVPIRDALNICPMKIAGPQQEFLHQHKNFELLYILHGEGGIKTQNENIRCYEGSLCLIAPDFLHDVYAEPNSDVISLALWRSSVEDILHKLLREENIMSEFFYTSLYNKRPGYVELHLPPKQCIGLVKNIFQEGYSQEAYAKDICAEYIGLLFYYALRACTDSPELFVHSKKRAGVPMAAVVQYIQDHYRTVSLTELAAFFHYEPDYLSRQIKTHMGKSFVKLVLQIKIDKAKQLLRETEYSITQIADYIGFSSTVHFSQTFRIKTGMSPSEYRNQ